MPVAFEPLLSAAEAAPLLGFHPRTLLRKAHEGEVPCIRVFDKVFFRESMLNAWVASLATGYTGDSVRAA